MRKSILAATAALILLAPLSSFAQSVQVAPDTTTVARAQVTRIVDTTAEDLPGATTGSATTVNGSRQDLEAEIIDGPEKGKDVDVEDDYIPLKPGEIFYVSHTVNELDGTDYYNMQDPDRMPALYALMGIFVLLVVIFGGKQGVRGLASLAGSLVLILFALMPAIVHGFSPVIAAIGVSSLIIVVGSYITHGFNKTTSAAVLGMIATVLFTGTLAFIFVHLAKLTGMTTEESVSLNWNTGGTINFVSLLLGGIMIGLLGVLYDMAIGQAIAVEELSTIGAHLPRKHILKRALRIGREHIGALVNTLVIAYVGASLPLLLLVYTGASGGAHEPLLNQEIFSTEVVRTLIGAIGIVLAMPLTTIVATFMLTKKHGHASKEELHDEETALRHFHHSH